MPLTDEERKARRRESDRVYRERNREKFAGYSRAQSMRRAAVRNERARLKIEDPELYAQVMANIRDNARRRREANRQKLREKQRCYYEKNKEMEREKARERSRKYREDNAEKVREKKRLYEARKRAERLAAEAAARAAQPAAPEPQPIFESPI